MSTVPALIVIFSCLSIGVFIGFMSKKKYDEIKNLSCKIEPCPKDLEELNVDAEFDIEGLNVIGVERFSSGETNFGYIISDNEPSIIKEWKIKTTNERHKEFVDRLTKKIQSQNSQK